ncbi:DUF6544 family protein [Anaerosporobacter faecicola]|uniref:DUF6544 family protein n=1 Tax=Anaerosporobacter faecicola TaxID=2718714 RepID=UPI00143B85A7|nr:DUF6544 family protein [Anaerosporobacter faecicola]
MRRKRRKHIMIIIGFILILVGGVFVYWNISYSPYKAAFDKKMKARVKKIQTENAVCTAEEIAQLPEVMQRYCSYIGLEGYPKYPVSHTEFYQTDFVFDSQSGKRLKMDYDLWLFFQEPYRSAYCSSSMFGVPFDGVDYCTDDLQGGMKGILGKAIQIFDVKSKQGYQAILLSWLAESVAINPSAILSPYVTYEQIDDLHVKATIAYNGVSGTGVFTLNEEGAIVTFYTDERQVEKINGVDTKIGWRCDYEDYRQDEDVKRIHTVRSVKVFPDREVVYFESNNFKITNIGWKE